MLTLENCPVTLEELRKAQRFPPEVLDDDLEMCLLAAAEHCSVWMGRGVDFSNGLGDNWSNGDCPNSVKRAIIMLAGRLFKYPNDQVDTQMSLVTNFLYPFRLSK